MAVGTALVLQHLFPAPSLTHWLGELQRIEVREQILPVRFGSGRRHDALSRKCSPHRRSVVPQITGHAIRTVGLRESRAQVASDLWSLVPQSLPSNGMALLAPLPRTIAPFRASAAQIQLAALSNMPA